MPPNKLYPIHKSPLYQLQSKKKLAGLLCVDQGQLRNLATDVDYNVFWIRPEGKKPRSIQEPVGARKSVHSRLKRLLSRVEMPQYVFSGRKGVSYVANAKYHVHSKYFVTIDIESFYPSCTIEYVFRFFHFQMKMSQDVAWLLAKIVTYDGHVQTGSPLSQLVAYWAHSRTFDTINRLAHDNGMVFSLYVDDMTFSSQYQIPNNFHLSVNCFLKMVGLKLKRSKLFAAGFAPRAKSKAHSLKSATKRWCESMTSSLIGQWTPQLPRRI